MKTPPLRLLLASLALATSLTSQIWIGGTSTSWNDPANWDTGTVPDGPAATATFAAVGLDPEFNTDISMATDRTLGRIVFAADARPVTLYAGHDSLPSAFQLVGDGVKNHSATQQRLWLTSPVFNHTNEITLTFRNQATITGNVRLIAIGENRHITFHEQTSAGSATIASYNTDFYDQSTAATATFDQTMAATVTFHDLSTAAEATLPGYYGSVTFADYSSAGSARIKRPEPVGSSSQVFFRDTSTAGSSELYVNNVEFSGNATAAQARLNNAGGQVYSSHGAYATHFATATFRDWSRAGDAVIDVNSLATLTFTGGSSAERATITNAGSVTFADRAHFADARLLAGSGTYHGYGGYNQPAPLVTVGDVVFKDQSTGGNGSIEITSAAARLDFSGLYSGTGTTGRAGLPTTTTAPAVVPDDRVTFSLGSLTNTAPGGTIHLGGTVLAIGTDNRDMTLSARISDIGGRFGTATSAPLAGGALQKKGTGILTLSNADAGYGVQVDIMEGTVRLDGGATGNAILSGSGRLMGSGTVRGHLANGTFGAGAMVSPGNSTGTITVTGNYTQSASASLNMEVASTTDHDRLVVNGSALLNGTLNVFFVNGFIPVGNTSIPLLTAGSITGSFSTVNLSPSLGAGLTATTGTVTGGLGLIVTQKPFAGFTGASTAGSRFGGYLDGTVATSTGQRRALLAGLNSLPDAAAIATALDALSPDRYAVLGRGATQAAVTQQSARDRWLATQRGRTGRGFDLFFEASRRRGRFDATAAAPAANVHTDGGSAGALWHNDGTSLALCLTQESGDLALDAAGSRIKLDSVVPALSFQHVGERFFVHLSAARANDDHELERRIVHAGVNGTTVARPSAARTDFAFTVGQMIKAGGWTVTPAAGLLRTDWKMNAFTETGLPGANLAFSDWSARALHARVLLETAYRRHGFTPVFSFGWLHAVTSDHSMQAGLDGAGSSYAVPSRSEDKNLFQGRVSFEKRLGQSARLTLAAGGTWGDYSRVTSELSAGLRWEF